MILFHVKATGKGFLRQKVKLMGFSMVCVMLQVIKTATETLFGTIILWLVLTQNISYTSQHGATEANVCKSVLF